MTPGQPHPLRCETCNRPIGKPDGTNDCPISIPSHLDVAVVLCFEQVGCASHSASEQQRIGKVIRELEDIPEEQCDCEVWDGIQRAITLLQEMSGDEMHR